jgi:hypothetical protein
MSHSFLPHVVEKAILRLFEDIGSSRSLAASLLYRYGEWDQLSTLEMIPEHYNDAESFWRDALATNIVRKLDVLPTSVDKKTKAEETFLSCEAKCFRANRRLYCLGEPPYGGSFSDGVLEVFLRARKIVSSILGPCPDLIEGRHGPGSTYSDRGKFCTVPDKMSSRPTITPDAWPFLFPWSGTLWASACASSGRLPEFVPGNRFLTVPKDSTKFRGIAVEPSINLFYQLGYGRVIRRRLSQHGINLAEGQDKHRALARCASSAGHLATLDLKNASDTICRNLVKLLLPPSWFSVLDGLRSKKTKFRGRFHLLEKFSSMGNGFTFELETLIFLSLIASITGRDSIGKTVFVFGDDIICPTESSQDVISLLSFCGLTVNKTKSFVDGPFRESCGGDYFLGVDVRPFFLKESPNEPQQLISFANGLRRTANRSLARDHIVNRAWLTALDGLPSEIRRCRGPEDLGDIVIHDSEERWTKRHRYEIRYLRCYRPARFKKIPWAPSVAGHAYSPKKQDVVPYVTSHAGKDVTGLDSKTGRVTPMYRPS